MLVSISHVVTRSANIGRRPPAAPVITRCDQRSSSEGWLENHSESRPPSASRRSGFVEPLGGE